MYMRATFRAPNFSPDLKLKKLNVLCCPANPFSTAIRMRDMTLLNVRFALVSIPLSMLCDHVVVGKAASPKTQKRIPVSKECCIS
jgi:hypothetical protein